jgi:hypothetical protein
LGGRGSFSFSFLFSGLIFLFFLDMGQTVGGILGKAVDWTISACGFPGGSYAGGAVASIIGICR